MLRRTLASLVVSFATTQAIAQAAPPSASNVAPAACAALTSVDNAFRFAAIPSAPTAIVSADVIAPDRDVPEYCRVEGSVAPSVGFQLRLPTKNWNGKFMMVGCGGSCGQYIYHYLETPLIRGYAVVTTDMGHRIPLDFRFAYNNLLGVVDFGFRATHVTAVAAKVLVAAFYEKPAERNYFWGCSTGGRQGLMAAQRFPEDFDGIVSGAPVLHETGDGAYFLNWNMRSNRDANGAEILKVDRLPLLKRAVLDSCDALDGLRDGILQNPRQCKWEPGQIQCPAGAASTESCLTPAEVGVARKFYSGAVNSKGEKLYFGMPLGAEDQWAAFLSHDGNPPLMQRTAETLTRYASFFDYPGDDYTMMDFDYDKDPSRLNVMEVFYNVQNPDLRRFKGRGGKLISYFGWNDNNIPAEAIIDYYDTATLTMGGEAKTKEFYRLFMLPSVNHCRGGMGGGEVDWIGALENWVEKGQAPESVLAHRMKQEPYPMVTAVTGERLMEVPRHPLDPSSYETMRPVFAYPDVAVFSGKGDPSVATSWKKARRDAAR